MYRSDRTTVATRTARVSVGHLIVAATLLCGAAGIRPAHADNMVQDWNNEFLLITQQTSGSLVAGPPDVAREIAQVGAAMSDAVNASTGNTIASFSGYTATGNSSANTNASVAAAYAAYTTLNSIFTDSVWTTSITSLSGGTSTGTSNVALGSLVTGELSTFLSSELSSLCSTDSTGCSSTSTYSNGLSIGTAAATAVDSSTTFSPTGSGAIASIINGLTPQTPTGSGAAGVYVPPATRPEMFPTWNTTTPTGITSSQLTTALGTISGPPPLTSQAYATGLLQTECEGASGGFSSLPSNVQSACAAAGFVQTSAQAQASANAALFWNDPGTTVQPPGHWLQIADTAMTSQNSSLLQSAQLTGLVGESMNDAGIAAWTVKYQNNLWRPTTAIRDCANWSSDFTTCDTSWSSLIATPPHPDYVAGHPAFSGAAATVLADFFGTDNVSFSSTSDYYCNGGSAHFGSNGLLVSCSVGATFYYVSNPTTGQPDCQVITSGAATNGSPLICPITENFNSFSAASSGTNGSEFSRVVGGIHTPAAVEDALTLGIAIGQTLAQNAGLPEVVAEPSSLAICAVSLVGLTGLRRRRQTGQAARA